jgi:two-component system CheB/CheR fusion protein
MKKNQLKQKYSNTNNLTANTDHQEYQDRDDGMIQNQVKLSKRRFLNKELNALLYEKDVEVEQKLTNDLNIPYMVNYCKVENPLLQTNETPLDWESDKSNLDKQERHNSLKEINQYFNSSFRSLIQIDDKLCIRTFTSAVKNQINIRESDVGRPLSDLTNLIKNLDLLKEVKSAMKAKTNKAVYKEVESVNGMWYSMLIEPFGTEENARDKAGVNIAFHDITSLTLSKMQGDRDKEKLQRINKDHENFIYSVSHDLKSPLNNMEALVSLINTADDNQHIKELGLLLVKSVKGLRETVNELTDITNIEKDLNGEEPVELPSLIEEIKWSLDLPLNSSFAILDVDLKIKELNFSRKNLRSIIYNLLNNAIKYKCNNRQLKIEIRTRKEHNFTVLSVIDNGRGISEAQIESIFAKFKRVCDGEDIEGSGIGLFLINRMVSAAGGEIKVKSVLGKGSTFEVYFPVKIIKDSDF